MNNNEEISKIAKELPADSKISLAAFTPVVTATALSVFRPVAPFGDLPFLASSPLATE
jgi:hypothetical protein